VMEEHVGGGGGARWEGSLGNRRRRPTRCFDGCLQCTVAQWPAWRGAETHESGVGWSVLRRLVQRSAVRAEQSGCRSATVEGRGETASPTD
jgi:hypothetical protein